MECYDLSLEGHGNFNDKLSSMEIEWPSDIVRAKGYYKPHGGSTSQTIKIDYHFSTEKGESFRESEQLQLSEQMSVGISFESFSEDYTISESYSEEIEKATEATYT